MTVGQIRGTTNLDASRPSWPSSPCCAATRRTLLTAREWRGGARNGWPS